MRFTMSSYRGSPSNGANMANQDIHQLLSHFSVNNRKIHASLVGILNLLFLEFVGVLNLLMDRFRTVRI